MKKSREFLAAITVTFALVACQDERSDVQYVATANDRITAGDFRGATIELKNALQQNPENVEARCLLGEVYLREGNAAGAEKELNRASELGVSEDTVLPSLARALLTLGKYNELADLPADKMSDGRQRAVVLAAKGLGKLAEGDSGAAADLVDQAVSLAPGSVYVVVARAQVMAAANEKQLARQELEKAFVLDANYAPAWSLAGDLHSANNELADAEQAYSKAIDGQSNDLVSRFKRALIRIRQTDFEGAQSDIDALKKIAPRSLEASYAQGLLSFNTKDFKKAQAAFDDVLVFDEKNTSALFYLAYTHLIQNNLDQAEHYVERFVALAQSSVAGQVLLAAISYSKGDFAKAENLINPIVRTQPNNQLATDLLARALIQQNKTTEAVRLLEEEVERQPDSASTKLRLAVVLLASDAVDRGTAVIEEALALDPKLTQAHILRVTNFLNQKAFAQAVNAAKAFVAQYPQSSMAHDMMGAAYLQSGQLGDAKRAFMRADELAPGDLAANRNLAQMAIAQKDYVAAHGFYSNILSKDKGNLYALLDLAALDAMQNDEKAMVSRLEEAAKANPEASQPRLMLARYYLARGKPGQVPGIMRELSETASNTPAALEVTAQYQLSQRNFEEAQLTATKLIQAKPDNAQAHFILAWAYDGLRDRDNARKSLQKAVELAPDHFSARMALTYLLLADGERKLAEDQLGILTKHAPEHPGVLKLKAALAGSAGNQEAHWICCRMYLRSTRVRIAWRHWLSRNAVWRTLKARWRCRNAGWSSIPMMWRRYCRWRVDMDSGTRSIRRSSS